ncbi:MAG: ribosome maturation factor RimM [Clostridia bacterium]|nr:ribosome maturation factor RimM [Clostridia bacterium]
MIEFCKVVRPHGIDGKLKVQLFVDSYFDLSKVKKILIDSQEYTVKKITKIDSEYALIKLDLINTMNEAETLRNKIILVNDENLPKLPEGRFYIKDLINLDVVTKEGIKLGKIIDVENLVSSDVIYCTNDNKRFCFPWIKKLDVVVDIQNKQFIIDSAVFEEVVIYDY